MKFVASALVAAAALPGCSSIQSVPDPNPDTAGMHYFMPKKDFVVTVTITSNKPTKVSFTESVAYPDLSHTYLLAYQRNAIGKNTMSLTADEKGLLKTATSDVTAGISDVLKNLASAAATLSTLRKGGEYRALEADCADGDQVFVFEPKHPPKKVCGLHLSVERLGNAGTGLKPQARSLKSGIYYRQAQPYRVTVQSNDKAVHASTILFSPTDAPIRFLPITATFFANNHAEFAFSDGMPTTYKEDADGELIALFKLPADVVAAYFGAVGAVFDAFKSTDSKQTDALNSQVKLELAQQKFTACIAAIKANDTTTIAKLGC